MIRLAHVYRAAAALVAASVLAGCGAQAMSPTGTALSGKSARAMSTVAAEAIAAEAEPIDVDRLIANFKAIQGFDEQAMATRIQLVIELGDSDDDRAMAFLQAEYESLSSYPAAVRQTYETHLAQALDALDTYDETLDEAIIAAGEGTTAVAAAEYRQALARKKRHKGFIHWLTTPFRWVGNGLKWIWNGLTGKKKKKKKRRKPRPQPDPGYPTDPAYPPANY